MIFEKTRERYEELKEELNNKKVTKKEKEQQLFRETADNFISEINKELTEISNRSFQDHPKYLERVGIEARIILERKLNCLERTGFVNCIEPHNKGYIEIHNITSDLISCIDVLEKKMRFFLYLRQSLIRSCTRETHEKFDKLFIESLFPECICPSILLTMRRQFGLIAKEPHEIEF